MANSVKLIIHRSSTIYDRIIITPYSVIKHEETAWKTKSIDQVNGNITIVNANSATRVNKISLKKTGYNAYVVSAYVSILLKSDVYRKSALKKLLQYLVYKIPNQVDIDNIIFIKLRIPKKQFLDYKWNERITQMAMERREVDHAMSWLSTLGGAFSALGEEFQYCAEMAGKISVQQFQLALRLGDPLLVARCKLYAALSLIQRGQLKMPRTIVQNVYKFSMSQNDIRLQNMCLGIWAKLKYCYKMRKERHKRIQN